MCRRVAVLLLATALFAPAGFAAEGPIPEVLRRADRYRRPEGPVRVELEVELWERGERTRTKRYTVYTAPGRRSLVVCRSPEEAGQKVLMVDDQYWILLPRTRRPVRITPAQKLLGEAATGDVATMTWGGDYGGAETGAVRVGDTPCRGLELRAARAGVTYDRVALRVSEADGAPVEADLYLASGRIAKTASFTLGTLGGAPRVVAMTLVDRIQRDRVTVVRYLAMEPRAIPEKLFNPAFLVQDGGAGL